MNKCTFTRYALAAAVAAASAFAGVTIAAAPASAQVLEGPAPYAGPYEDYGYPRLSQQDWATILANRNRSVPFIPGDAALSYRYGRGDYGNCGFTVAGC